MTQGLQVCPNHCLVCLLTIVVSYRYPCSRKLLPAWYSNVGSCLAYVDHCIIGAIRYGTEFFFHSLITFYLIQRNCSVSLFNSDFVLYWSYLAFKVNTELCLSLSWNAFECSICHGQSYHSHSLLLPASTNVNSSVLPAVPMAQVRVSNTIHHHTPLQFAISFPRDTKTFRNLPPTPL